MKQVKTLALLLALMLLVSGIAMGGATNELPISDGSITLSVATGDNYYAANSYADNLPVWQIIEEATGVKIDWQVTEPSQYDAVMRVRIAANVDMPDLFQVPGNMPLGDLSDQGIALVLDDYVAQYAPNWTAAIEAHPLLRTLSCDPSGNMVVSQVYKDGQNANLRVPIVRKDWLDKLNLEIPTTLDEYYNCLKAIVEGDPNGNGVADEVGMMCNNWKDFFVFITAFGLPSRVVDTGFYPDENGKMTYVYTGNEMRDTLAFLNKLYAEKLIDQDFVTSTRDIVESTYPKNIVGFGWQAPGVDIRWDGFVRSAGVEDVNHVQINPPVDESGKTGFYKDNPISSRCAISANTKIPEIAVRWLDYVQYSPEGTLHTTWGVEGTSYELVDGKPVLTEWALKNPDGLDINSAVRSLGAFHTFFNIEPLAFMEGKLQGKTVEALKVLQPNALDPVLLVPETPEESEAVAAVSTDINTFVDEMLQKFIIGSEPLSNWDSFVEKVNSMGVNVMIDTMQARYDRTYGQ